MSPNNIKSATNSNLPPLKKLETVNISNAPPPNKIIRDEIFSRFDKPFGLEQHTFNLVMMYIIPWSFCLYFTYECMTTRYPWSSVLLFTLPYGYLGGLGITVGCHRYWTHKSFKANFPLQVILMCFQTIAMKYPIHKWCLDHRIHHKYTDTDSDPHNSKRGLWFSHIGWHITPKRKEHVQKLATFDMSDLETDPVVRFQSKYYWTLAVLLHFVIPTFVLRTIWGLPILSCVAQAYVRYSISLQVTSMVNSFAHAFGDKPFDKTISSTDNPIVSFLAIGEGWHNYHHTFPWDYKAAEFGWKLNFSTMFIDFFAAIGWAWDLKTASPKMLEERIRRTGEVSCPDICSG